MRGPVAVKMLRNVNGEAMLRLKTEFRALRDLHHPNLVRLGELFADQRACFFTDFRYAEITNFHLVSRGQDPQRTGER